MESSDVIEIGEDGTFEIPMTRAAKPTTDSINVEKAKFSLPEVIMVEQDTRQPSVLDIIGAGEYKVFRKKSTTTIYVLVCLHDNESMKAVSVSQNAVLINLEGEKQLEIPLPSPVNASSAISKVFKKYVTVQVSCI